MPSKPTVTVRIRLFARYAELLGQDSATVHLEAPATVGDAVAAVRSRLPSGHLLPEHPLVALNRQHVLSGTPVGDSDELALLPPLAGG